MRYTIEAKSKKLEGIIEEFIKKEKLILVEKYDPFEKLSKDVEKMGLALRKFQKSGIDWDVFNTYLRGKGTSQGTIDAVMVDVKSFFLKVGLLPEKKWNDKTSKYEYQD